MDNVQSIQFASPFIFVHVYSVGINSIRRYYGLIPVKIHNVTT